MFILFNIIPVIFFITFAFVVISGIVNTKNSIKNHTNENQSLNNKPSIFSFIYTLLFTILWLTTICGMMFFVVFYIKEPLFIFAFLPFLAIGIFLIFKVKKEFKIYKNPNSINNTIGENKTIKEDDYHFKLCNYCGTALNKDDNFCPNCGAKKEN